MHSYTFFLGRKNFISLAELESKLPAGSEFTAISREFAIISFAEKLKNPQNILNQLGGTIKIAQVFDQIPNKWDQAINSISKILKDQYSQDSKKLSYAISISNFTQKPEIILKRFLIKLKKELISNQVKSRFFNNNFQNPETAQLKGENVPTEGVEINILNYHQNFYLTKTIAIQDIDSYSKRDYERPERDPRLGMLPPKLAQILINIAGLKTIGQKDEKSCPTIYDPFCGIGTVLSEGFLMDFNVIGSDLDQNNVFKTQRNLSWLKSEYPQQQSNSKVFQKEISYLEENNLGQKIEAVISETWLGPPVKICPAETQIDKTFEQVEKLISGLLDRIKNFEKSNPVIVLTILTYFQKPRRYIFPKAIIKRINQNGYQIEPLISTELIEKFNVPCPNQYELIYSRPDQIACRTIIKLTRSTSQS